MTRGKTTPGWPGWCRIRNEPCAHPWTLGVQRGNVVLRRPVGGLSFGVCAKGGYHGLTTNVQANSKRKTSNEGAGIQEPRFKFNLKCPFKGSKLIEAGSIFLYYLKTDCIESSRTHSNRIEKMHAMFRLVVCMLHYINTIISTTYISEFHLKQSEFLSIQTPLRLPLANAVKSEGRKAE